MKNNDLLTLSSCASLLEQTTKIHLLSLSFTIAGFVIATTTFGQSHPSYSLFFLFILVVLSVIETWYTIRVGFDAKLLRKIAQQFTLKNESLANLTNLDDLFEQLDQSLQQLGLIKQHKSKPIKRTLSDRLTGCLALFKYQILCIFLQLLVIAAFVAFQYILV